MSSPISKQARSRQTWSKQTGLLALGLLCAFPAIGQPSEPRIGDRIASFEMTWAQRSQEEVARRAHAVAEVLAGTKLQRSGVEVRSLKRTAERDPRWEVRVADAPDLHIRYLPRYDELRALSRELLYATAPTEDVGRERALEIARQAFAALADAGVVDARQFNWKKADVASTVAGEGSLDGKTPQRRFTVEYRITVLREINGIEVANAGVRLAVHASGRLSGVRVGGVSVASKPVAGAREEPTGKGRWLTRKLASADLLRRFERDGAPAGARVKVAWSRVLYVMDERQQSAVVEPYYVVAYALHVPTDEGQVAVSRGKVVGYSLTDPSAKAVDLVPPVRPPREGDSDKKLAGT